MTEQPEGRTLYQDDCLSILKGIDTDSIDWIYLDPPFGTARGWFARPDAEASGASFSDSWEWDEEAGQASGRLELSHPSAFVAVALARRTRGDAFGAYLAHMAIRLAELARVLRPSGTLLLHCDPTANSYLRLLLDALLGSGSFRNELVWRRTAAHNNAQRFGAIHDSIYYYAGEGRTWHPITRPYSTLRLGSHEDEHGRYDTFDLIVNYSEPPAEGRAGSSARPWRGCDPAEVGGHWAIPRLEVLPEWAALPDDLDRRTHQERLDLLDDAGLIHWPPGRKKPRVKRYVDGLAGLRPQDMITHIWRAHGEERLGYPTQKPVALLEWLLQITSDPGDLVLDPYCGTGTTLVAAERLGRRWIGIDISPDAHRIATERVSRDGWLDAPGQSSPALLSLGQIASPAQPPERTDLLTQIGEQP